MSVRHLNIKYPLMALVLLLIPFQNCSSPVAFQPAGLVYDSLGRPVYSGQLVVTPSKPNPPLKLFFVIDNSASMLGHQIDLGTQFSTLFSSASNSLQGFDTTIYVFSTASTYNQDFLNQIPTRAPSSISLVPSANDIANLAETPGSIFSYWNSTTGTFGNAPFSMQIAPAPVLDNSDGNVTAQLFIPKKGSMSDSDYNNQIATITNNFKSRLSYLNPTSQTSYSNLTDVSSGLCTMARIVHHSSDFIRPGDSTAFIITSDDDDRMNVRNPNGNSCVESVIGSNNLINGNCGHYQTNYGYSTSSNISYLASRKFNFQSGTSINYSYPTSETCTLSYNDGYTYSSTYTALRTDITYTRCDLWGDGTCLTPHPNYKVTVSGNYVSSGTTCSQDMTSLSDNPAPGTSFSCATDNLAGQAGPGGDDTASTGAACSMAVLNSLQASNKLNVACMIVGAHTKTGVQVGNQAIGSCANYCSSHGSTYPGCALTSTSTNKTGGSIKLAVNGVTCSSTCPVSGQCGSGTVLSYIQNTYGASTTCDSTSVTSSSITVNAGANSDGTQLSCSSSLAGHTVTGTSGTVCGSASTVLDCIQSMQSGTTSSGNLCNVDNSTSLTYASVPLNDSCTTTCAASNAYCAAPYTTVADAIAKKLGGYCSDSQTAGAGSLSLTFRPSVSQTADCNAKCADTTTGSCDGLGWGAGDNSSVGDYINSQKSGVGSCSSSVQFISDSSIAGANSANPVALCQAGKFFSATSGVYAGTATNYTTGNANHVSADFINYITAGIPQSTIAVITQLPGDNLYGTSVGQQYINLATQMGSNQISSIKGNYSSALNNVSDFIVKSALNNYLLPLESTNFVFAVSVMRQGTTTWTPIDASSWSVSGTTLTMLPSVSLQVGDQLMYQYRMTE